MEFTTDKYKRSIGRVFTTSDGNEYIQSKLKGNYTYLRCVIFRNTCKVTSKLNRETNLITPLKGHKHDVDEYRSEIFADKRQNAKRWLKIHKPTSENYSMMLQGTVKSHVKSRFLTVIYQCIVRERRWNLKYHRMLLSFWI